ncbi:MAG TPA: serine/threonine-protein kinase [Kofleriaceae bacterium]|nr:serine/threonine-protein kinase [Kofleriaceae bacterium]
MQELEDAYDVEGELGRGGAARVVAARERVSGRAVAIKELLSDEPSGFAALAREARLVASLAHPGIVGVLDAGVWLDGTPYLVMPRLVGHTLFAAMTAARTARARRALVPVVAAACEAMAHAHARGVVHRDLTPSNIFVGDDGAVTVLDWGLAVEIGAAAHDGVAGTLEYMAPEQLRGDAIDARADVHALGVILGELCGDDARAPRALRLLAVRSAAFEPAERPRDAGELGRELRRSLGGLALLDVGALLDDDARHVERNVLLDALDAEDAAPGVDRRDLAVEPVALARLDLVGRQRRRAIVVVHDDARIDDDVVGGGEHGARAVHADLAVTAVAPQPAPRSFLPQRRERVAGPAVVLLDREPGVLLETVIVGRRARRFRGGGRRVAVAGRLRCRRRRGASTAASPDRLAVQVDHRRAGGDERERDSGGNDPHAAGTSKRETTRGGRQVLGPASRASSCPLN